jgi:hypothetical protein
MTQTVDPDSIPEVANYLALQQRLEAYKRQHEPVIEGARILLELLDSARQAADKTVRAAGVFCGPWTRHRESTEYDADKLLTALGLERFLEIGGKKDTTVQYSVDKNKVAAAIAVGQIPKDLAEAVTSTKVAYSAPKPPTL